MNPELAKKFNTWLDTHFDPVRTQAGAISRRGGVVRYPDKVHRRLRTLLGGAYPKKAIRKARKGDDVPARLKMAIATIVELENEDAILRHRLIDKVAEELARGRRHKERFGHAPDGGELEDWARRRVQAIRERLDLPESVELTGEAQELYDEIVMPPANRWREERRAA